MDFAGLLETDCAGIDIGFENLRCSHGLPGTEQIDLGECLRTLDRWAEHIDGLTQRLLPQFQRRPAGYWNSPAKFRVLAMVTALQRDLGVTYDFSCLTDPIDLSDAAPWFVFGPLSGRGGTCVSLPVLYAAVGRRLGYPLFFVRAKEHYFLRWEEPGERFNVECTSRGFEPYDDGHYLAWPKPLTERDLATGHYLRNLSPREELAGCFVQRALCLLDDLRADDALDAFRGAEALAPGDPFCGYWNGIATAVATYLDYERAGSDFDRVVPKTAGTPPFVLARQELARIRGLRARKRQNTLTEDFAMTACFFAAAD